MWSDGERKVLWVMSIVCLSECLSVCSVSIFISPPFVGVFTWLGVKNRAPHLYNSLFSPLL